MSDPRPSRAPRRRALPGAAVALLGLALAGCASTGPAPVEERRVRFAVIPAPRLADASASPSAEDLLLEAVTLLSTRTDLDFCLIPGPLLAGESEAACRLLADALGSLAGPVYPAPAGADGPGGQLLEQLARGLRGHPGRAAYQGPRAGPVRPLVLDAAGQLPPRQEGAEEDGPDVLRVAVTGGPVAEDLRLALLVGVGQEVRLSHGPAGAELRLPPLTEPPHWVAIGTLDHNLLSVELLSVTGEPPPPEPTPVPVLPR